MLIYSWTCLLFPVGIAVLVVFLAGKDEVRMTCLCSGLVLAWQVVFFLCLHGWPAQLPVALFGGLAQGMAIPLARIMKWETEDLQGGNHAIIHAVLASFFVAGLCGYYYFLLSKYGA